MIFYVEEDDLRFEEEEVAEEEELAVDLGEGRGYAGGWFDKGGGQGEGLSGLVDDFVGEVIEDGGVD